MTLLLPEAPGSYALYLNLAETRRLPIGRLGIFLFPAGDYLYLGSAHGPGGLRARLLHHARVTANPHWHLDWLRPQAELLGAWFTCAPGGLECGWSQAVCRLAGAVVPAPGFGAADCHSGCPAHLMAFPGGIGRETLETALRAALLAGHEAGATLKWMPFLFPETRHLISSVGLKIE
jgi:Uri superfamily endonuclease